MEDYADWILLANLSARDSPVTAATLKTQGKCLSEFFPPKKNLLGLSNAIAAFDLNPLEFLGFLERLRRDVFMQDVAVYMTRTFGDCFISMCTELREQRQIRLDEGTKSQQTWAVDASLSEIGPSAGSQSEKSTPNATETTAHPLLAKYDEVYPPIRIKRDYQHLFLKDVFAKAALIWGQEKVRNVDSGLHEVMNHFRPGYAKMTLPDLSFRVINTFDSNVWLFTTIVTGEKVSEWDQIDVCYDKLRLHGLTKIQNFKPIYMELQSLRDTVEKQAQIITSLQYRRLIEHLPNQDHYTKHSKLQSNQQTNNSTRYWKELWIDLVEKELSLMIHNPSPGSTRPLAELLQSDFERWRKKNSKANVVPRREYETWNPYKRGLQLYGELSSNIHQFNGRSELYDVKETNWSRSERLMLAALRPTEYTTAGEIEDVDWDKERAKRGLP